MVVRKKETGQSKKSRKKENERSLLARGLLPLSGETVGSRNTGGPFAGGMPTGEKEDPVRWPQIPGFSVLSYPNSPYISESTFAMKNFDFNWFPSKCA